MCDCCCGGLQSIAPPSVLCSLGPLFLCPVLDEWHTRHDSTSLFSYQSPLWVFSSRGSFRAWAQTPDLTQSLGCGLAARRAQDGPTARCLPLSASALLLRHVCYRSHSTLFLSASSQLPFKGIWIIIKVSLTLTRVPMPSFSFCHKNPPVYLEHLDSVTPPSPEACLIWRSIPGGQGSLHPTCTLSWGGCAAVSLCPLTGKPSSRAHLKALLFVTGFDYNVLCVSGSWGLTELLGSGVLEFPSNWENCSCVSQAHSLPCAV